MFSNVMNIVTGIRERGGLHISLFPVLLLFLTCLLLPADALAAVTSVWFIELPVFPDRIPADLFIGRLAEKGFRAEVVTAQTGAWTSYRTVTMPFSSFAEAAEYQSKLRGKTNLLNEHLRIVGPVAGLAGSWSVDLLHFSERGRAASFIKRLANKGINAVIIPVHITGKIHFQTRIVAIRSRMAAEAYLQQLKQRTNIRDQHLQLVAPMQLAVEKRSRRIAITPALAGQTLATSVPVNHDAASGERRVFHSVSRRGRRFFRLSKLSHHSTLTQRRSHRIPTTIGRPEFSSLYRNILRRSLPGLGYLPVQG